MKKKMIKSLGKTRKKPLEIWEKIYDKRTKDNEFLRSFATKKHIENHAEKIILNKFHVGHRTLSGKLPDTAIEYCAPSNEFHSENFQLWTSAQTKQKSENFTLPKIPLAFRLP